MGPIGHSVAALTAIGLSPALAVALLVRPGLRRGLGERFGRIAVPAADASSGPAWVPAADASSGPVWVHASSVGEAKAARRLVAALETGGHGVRVSTSTVAGREAARRGCPAAQTSLLPFDHPWCVEAALTRVAPRLSVLIETELWPSWILACARRDVPVVVVSGRLSDRSFPRYRKLRRLLGPVFGKLEAVGARTDQDAERFVALGVPEARVEVTGDLKLDPPEGQPSLAIDLIRALADTPVFVGGSTHAGEEAALLDAMAEAEKAGHATVLALAPRDVGRANEVFSLCRDRGRRVFLRSALEGRHLVPGEVLVLDGLGELAALYATASVAFVGGTLVPVGGHNLVEPVHAGCPVLFGPRVENVRKIAEILETSGAGRRCKSPGALTLEVVEAFEDLEASRVRGEFGRDVLEAHRGSADQTYSLIERVLERRPRAAS